MMGAFGPSELPWPRVLTEIESRKYWVDAGPARLTREERAEQDAAERGDVQGA